MRSNSRMTRPTRNNWEHGPRIIIASREFAKQWDEDRQEWKGGRRHVDDVMVHEMTHAWLYITGQTIPGKTDHQLEAWYAAIRRLSLAVLGHDIDVRRGAERRSVRYKDADGISRVRKEKVPELEGPARQGGPLAASVQASRLRLRGPDRLPDILNALRGSWADAGFGARRVAAKVCWRILPKKFAAD
jgi:hypothetical protein